MSGMSFGIAEISGLGMMLTYVGTAKLFAPFVLHSCALPPWPGPALPSHSPALLLPALHGSVLL